MVYLVAGAYGGIGHALCKKLKAEGHCVIAAGKNHEKLSKLKQDLGVEILAADFTSPQETEECVSRAFKSHERLDGSVNLCGSLLLKPAHLTLDAEWEDTLRTHLFTSFYLLRESVKVMMKTGGSIVLVSSAAARTGIANHEAVAAAKAGVEGLALSAAATYAYRNIRVNVAAPGMIETPLTAKILASESARKVSAAMHPLGRIGTPEDAASAVAWLLGSESRWVTGQVLGVDGGLASLRSRQTAAS